MHLLEGLCLRTVRLIIPGLDAIENEIPERGAAHFWGGGVLYPLK
jgi:hypothetical protein